MRRSIRTTFVVGSMLASGTAVLAAQDMLVVGWGGEVFTVDSATGAGAFLANSGFIQLNAMAKAADGTLYASSGLSSTALISIDPNTGAGSLVANLSVGSTRGMSFHPDGNLYVVADSGGGDLLYRVTPGSWSASLVGNTGMPGLQGLACSSDGQLYGWDVGSGSGIGAGLVTIDHNTAATVDVDPGTNGSGSEVQGITFGGNLLYGSRDSLYTISLATGATTLVGGGGYIDTRGCEFVGGGLTLTADGTCPGGGPIIVSWSGATPNGQVGVVYANNTGAFVIPPGFPCAGTTLGLGASGIQLVFQGGAGANGSRTIQGQAPGAACGHFLQLVDGATCNTSDVATIQ